MKQNIKIALIDNNEGQIKDLPANPRFMRDDDFLKLRQSVIDDPEMLDLRELIVHPMGKRFVVIGGNMRLKAIEEVAVMKDDEFEQLVAERRENEDFLDWFTAIQLLRDKKEAPCKVLAKTVSAEKMQAYVIKDNVGFGKWDHNLLSSSWDEEKLISWGLEASMFGVPDDKKKDESDVDLSDFSASADSYLNNTVRQIVLYFDVESHKNTLAELARIGELYGIENDNAAVLLKLIEIHNEHEND